MASVPDRPAEGARPERVTTGPYGHAARQYRKQGWRGTLPLPANAKEEPPTGFTGHGADYPSDKDVRVWRKAKADGNICLRLAGVHPQHVSDDLPPVYAGNNVDGWELIGIDVDDYGDKHGAQQLTELEAELGPLPDTVVSSARWDDAPLSGTRLFLVPKGFRFRGKASATGHEGPKHIDILYAGLRYLVVWPSIHPTGSMYEFRWGRPGEALKTYTGVPPMGDVAMLPEPWFRHLQAGVSDGADAKSDMDFGELQAWAEATFRECGGEPCTDMADKLAEYKAELDLSDSHHPMNDVVWSLTKNALEGHAGWHTALNDYLTYWRNLSLSKRDEATLNAEAMRSVDGGLAKAKAAYDGERHGYMPDDTCAGGHGDVNTWAAKVDAADAADVTRSLADVRPTKVEWLWRPWLPLGKVSILEGEPDVGKSVVTLAWAATVTTGRKWPPTVVDGELLPRTKSNTAGVVLVGVEDDEDDTVVPRLDAAGANRQRVYTMNQPVDDNGNPLPFVIPADVDRLRRAITETNAKLVVIDPITAFLSTKQVKPGDDPSTRQALMPLVMLARDTGCAIVLVRHLNKATGMSAKNRGSGTIAYTGIARSVIVAGKLKEAPDGPTHAIALVKGNLTKDPSAIGYRLESAPGDHDSPVIRWCGPIDLSADQLVGADGAKVSDARKNGPVRHEAMEILSQLLADGPVEAQRAIRLTRQNADCGLKVVKAATKELHVVKKPVRVDGKIDHWTWELPPKRVKLSVLRDGGDEELETPDS